MALLRPVYLVHRRLALHSTCCRKLVSLLSLLRHRNNSWLAFSARSLPHAPRPACVLLWGLAVCARASPRASACVHQPGERLPGTGASCEMQQQAASGLTAFGQALQGDLLPGWPSAGQPLPTAQLGSAPELQALAGLDFTAGAGLLPGHRPLGDLLAGARPAAQETGLRWAQPPAQRRVCGLHTHLVPLLAPGRSWA